MWACGMMKLYEVIYERRRDGAVVTYLYAKFRNT